MLENSAYPYIRLVKLLRCMSKPEGNFIYTLKVAEHSELMRKLMTELCEVNCLKLMTDARLPLP